MSARVWDISPALTEDIAVFPGDTPMTREVLLDTERGDHLTLSTLHATVHLGAHADGANHYGGAGGVEAWSLSRFLGRCQIIEARTPRGQRVAPEHLQQEISEERVLIRTNSWPDPTIFNDDFCGLEPALAEYLADHNVVTVGVDMPSVDPPSAKTLSAHHALRDADIAILECLRLAEVPVRVYELIALPLPLVGFDASPVRAVLREI